MDGGASGGGFRSATPNKKYADIGSNYDDAAWDWVGDICWFNTYLFRGQYSDAVLSSLESQNESEVEGISAKVKMLKNVCMLHVLEISDILIVTRSH